MTSAKNNKKYYKKKIGRPKKRGPKKKLKKRGRSWQEPWNYKVIKCISKKQDKVIGIFHTLREVNDFKSKLIDLNNQVIFPKKHTIHYNNRHEIENYISEYIILEKNRKTDINNTTKIKNEYGKFVEHKTTNEKWSIIEKIPCLDEETFWVYGYNPKTERKTFQWITNELILSKLSLDNYIIIRTYIYYNKIIFRYDTNDLSFVICKNQNDALNLYIKLSETFKKNKRVIFTGNVINKSDMGKTLIKILQEKTGWSITKIKRKATTS